jgi:Na+-driven multidrug efflux pump
VGQAPHITVGGTVLTALVAAVLLRSYQKQLLTTLSAIDRPDLTFNVNVVFIGLNAALIFGLGPFPDLGIAGAAWGTTIAETLSGVIFLWLLVGRDYDVRLRPGGRQLDAGLVAELVRVSAPLAGSRLVGTFGRFPFLFVLGVFGTGTLAAYAIGRRVVLLAMMPAWGYSTAASTLVGQRIGEGDGDAAARYGWSTLRIAVATQVVIAVVIVVFARPISLAFGSEYVGETVTFDAPGSSDPDGPISEYRWDVDGDGSVDAATSSATRDHSYGSTGEKTPAVTVVDTAGATASASDRRGSAGPAAS